jgi:hypothetical protein
MSATDKTPVTITERYRHPRTGNLEVFAAVSADGQWTFNRDDSAATPWIVTHVPTGGQAWFTSLPGAQRCTANGVAHRMIAQNNRPIEFPAGLR